MLLLMKYSSVDIALSESTLNLSWGPIMKTINESPYDFFQQGGWSFLGSGGDDVCLDNSVSLLDLLMFPML